VEWGTLEAKSLAKEQFIQAPFDLKFRALIKFLQGTLNTKFEFFYINVKQEKNMEIFIRKI